MRSEAQAGATDVGRQLDEDQQVDLVVEIFLHVKPFCVGIPRMGMRYGCAWAAVRTKGSYLQAQFQRLRSRRGAKKAIGAVAASILTAAYHMLKNGTLYEDLGADHFDNRAKDKGSN